MKHILENNVISIAVNDIGAELIRVYDKEKEREILWQADPAFWNRQSPILFPNVGKYYQNKYLYQGNVYEQGQHGFARDMEFECVNKTEDKITHRVLSTEETKENYPFDFTLEVSYSLHGSSVKVEWSVKNRSNTEMYFTIGGHPAFNVPIIKGTKQTDYKLLFRQKDAVAYTLLDLETGTALPEKKEILHLSEGQCDIKADMFDKDALVFDDGQIEWVAIGYPDGTPYVEMRCKGFSNFGIWSMPNAPFICLEPWIGRCDNQGFCDEISQKPNIVSLDVEKEFTAAYEIEIH